MFNNTKNIFLFILLAFVVTSCEDTESSEQDGHTDADGMEITTMLEDVETEMYSECLGSIDNEFANGVSAGSEWDFTVHFLDSNCEELEHDDEGHDDHDHGDDDHGDDDHSDEPYLVIELADGGSSIVSISTEDHDDHEGEEHCEDFTTEEDCGMHDECEWHADDMACEDAGHDDEDHDDHEEEHGYTFELETLTPGTTTFTVTLMHQGHADYTSAPITIVVE